MIVKIPDTQEKAILELDSCDYHPFSLHESRKQCDLFAKYVFVFHRRK